MAMIKRYVVWETEWKIVCERVCLCAVRVNKREWESERERGGAKEQIEAVGRWEKRLRFFWYMMWFWCYCIMCALSHLIWERFIHKYAHIYTHIIHNRWKMSKRKCIQQNSYIDFHCNLNWDAFALGWCIRSAHAINRKMLFVSHMVIYNALILHGIALY